MSPESQYKFAKEQFAAVGVDAEAALRQLDQIPVSMHCWQGDDVAGFEAPEKAGVGNGCLATGDDPGKATTPAQLMADIEQAATLIPGPLRLNLHASYATDGDPLPERRAHRGQLPFLDRMARRSQALRGQCAGQARGFPVKGTPDQLKNTISPRGCRQ